MVKGNNVLSNVHLRKDWKPFVKTWFNQPARKLRRRLKRQEKAAKNGLRPSGLLRPIVHPPTQRYNIKVRYGRGFTHEELKRVGISPKLALTIGIAVDHKRKNRCVESLETNVARLNEYKNKLIVFSRKSGKAKKGIGGIPDDTLYSVVKDKLTTGNGKIQHNLPLPKKEIIIPLREVTLEEKNFNAYETLKNLREALLIKKKKVE